MQFPLHALSCTCPFSEHFTLRSHYTPFTVLLLLHAVSFTCPFHSISITRLIHYTPFPLPAL